MIPKTRCKMRIKRVFDLVVILAALPLWLPVVGILWILVRIKLGKPSFFRQRRPGLRGKPFLLLKFRTMTDQRDKAGVLLPDEARMTPFGALLRSTSLDELPELWNVLKGEMSLVGPRPLLNEYLDYYTEAEAVRHAVRPGITGWAQVNGRNAIEWDAKLALDRYYVEHWSFWLDLKILWMTLSKVLRRDGISAEGEATCETFVQWCARHGREKKHERS